MTSFSPPARKTAARPATMARPVAPPLSADVARSNEVDNNEFERQVKLYLAPTDVRPALLVEPEADYLRQTYTTGSGRLKALRSIIGSRETRWEERRGNKPFDDLSPEQSAKADAFFEKHGKRLANEPRQAPPNPIAEREEAARAHAAHAAELERAKAEAARTAQAPAAPMPTAPAPAAPAGPEPAAAPRVPIGPPPAQLEISYLSKDGYACRLLLFGVTGTAVLETGQGALATLVRQGAQPLPAAPPVAVTVQAPPAPAAAAKAAPGDDESDDDGPPSCKIHKTPMKRNKFGWFCSKAVEENESGFCDYKIRTKRK